MSTALPSMRTRRTWNARPCRRRRSLDGFPSRRCSCSRRRAASLRTLHGCRASRRDEGGDVPVRQGGLTWFHLVFGVGRPACRPRRARRPAPCRRRRRSAPVRALMSVAKRCRHSRSDFLDSLTPASTQDFSSSSFILREELAMSIVSSPTPLQNSLMPAPEPPDSTTGS